SHVSPGFPSSCGRSGGVLRAHPIRDESDAYHRSRRLPGRLEGAFEQQGLRERSRVETWFKGVGSGTSGSRGLFLPPWIGRGRSLSGCVIATGCHL
ncbi:unnamed protein product, partial [Ectocarpus sp. 8 AP-2014]